MPLIFCQPYFKKISTYFTSLLMRGQGNNQEAVTGLYVASPPVLPIAGVTTAISQSGTSSLQMNGLVNEAFSTTEKTAFTFPGDYTIELFFKPKYKQAAYLFNIGGCEKLNWGSQTCYITSNGNVVMSVATEPTNFSVFNNTTAGLYRADEWNHLAITRSGSTYSVYLNGVRIMSGTNTKAPKAPPYKTTIGNFPYANDTDFSVLPSFTGQFDNFRVTKGVARYTGDTYTIPANFGRTAGVDPYWGNVTVLYDMEISSNGVPTDPNHPGVAALTRHSPTPKALTWSASGNKFGQYALVPNGGYIYPPVSMYDAAIGTADFTWELWYKPSVSYQPGQYQTLISSRPSGNFAETHSIALGLSAQAVYVYSDRFLIEHSAIAVNQWSHIALVRKDGVITAYINGAPIASYSATVMDLKRSQITIGANGDGGGLIVDAGARMCEVRLSNVARYDGAFTPPAAMFTVD